MILRLRRLRRRCISTGEAGSAVVEFVFLEVLILVPLVYLVMTLARVQAGAFAVATAAREAGRAYVTADTGELAPSRAAVAARLAFEDQGFARGEGTITVVCDATPCLRPEGRVQITATVTVPLPLVPAMARDVVPLAITMDATHVSVVDRFGGGP